MKNAPQILIRICLMILIKTNAAGYYADTDGQTTNAQPAAALAAHVAAVHTSTASPSSSDDATSVPVVVEGWAPLMTPPDIAASRAVAIENALTLAVEQRMGTAIESRRETSNHMIVEDRIRQTLQGDVASYRLLDEKSRDGNYWVRLAVELRADEVRRLDLSRMRLVLIVIAPGKSAEPTERDLAPRLRESLSQYLTAQGMHMIASDQLAFEAEPAVDKLASIAAATHADAVVIARVSSSQLKPLGDLKLAQVDLHARVFRPSSGEWNAELNAAGAGDRSSNVDLGTRQALSRASSTLARDLLHNLAGWRSAPQ